MTDAQIMMVLSGTIIAGLGMLRLAFCRILRASRRLWHDHGVDLW